MVHEGGLLFQIGDLFLPKCILLFDITKYWSLDT